MPRSIDWQQRDRRKRKLIVLKNVNSCKLSKQVKFFPFLTQTLVEMWPLGTGGAFFARKTHLFVYDDLQPHSLFQLGVEHPKRNKRHSARSTKNSYRLDIDITPAQIVYVAVLFEAGFPGSFVPPLE
jgi:hypothetical protein